MTDRCAADHTLLSEIHPVTDPKTGKVEFKSSGLFPDFVIGNGDTKEEAKKDAIKKSHKAAADFCANKNCAAGKKCIWSDVDAAFDAIEEYMTEGMGWFAVRRINIITCKCK